MLLFFCVMMDKKYMTRKEQVCNTEKFDHEKWTGGNFKKWSGF